MPVQTYKSIPLSNRNTINVLVLFKCSNKAEIRAIREEMTFLSKDVFFDLLMHCFKNPYDCIVIDRDKNEYYRKFNIIEIYSKQDAIEKTKQEETYKKQFTHRFLKKMHLDVCKNIKLTKHKHRILVVLKDVFFDLLMHCFKNPYDCIVIDRDKNEYYRKFNIIEIYSKQDAIEKTKQEETYKKQFTHRFLKKMHLDVRKNIKLTKHKHRILVVLTFLIFVLI